MNDRALRLDFILAIAALLTSALTTATLVYQTHVIQQQYSASIWPYLNVLTTNDGNRESIAIQNDGLGPLLIRSAQLSVDGAKVASWNAFVRILLRHGGRHYPGRKGSSVSNSSATVDASTTIRPGGSMQIFAVHFAKGTAVASDLLTHHIAVDFCYCSLNNNCWKLHATPGVMSGSIPQPISSCLIGASINSFIGS